MFSAGDAPVDKVDIIPLLQEKLDETLSFGQV